MVQRRIIEGQDTLWITTIGCGGKKKNVDLGIHREGFK